MNREEEKKQEPNQGQQTTKASDITANHHEDENQHSYQGELDHVEGRMNNGEIGGGIKKEEE